MLVAILGAFGQEIVDLRRQMSIKEARAGRECRLYSGKLKARDVLLVQTGMGKVRAENATRFILERYPVAAIISTGFAGGLSAELRIGDVVICSKLYGANGLEQERKNLEPLAPDANLLSTASRGVGNGAIPFHIVTGVTVPQLNSSARELQWLRESFHADVVDMESYWIARIASTRGIPFIAIRSISDNTESSVQPFDRILASDGRLLWKKAVLSFAAHPRYLINVYTLYKNTRPAKRNLAAFISHMVANLTEA